MTKKDSLPEKRQRMEKSNKLKGFFVATKFYVVWKGRQTGIFTDWTRCKQQVDQFAGAKYKSFPSRSEAEAAFSGKKIDSSPGKTRSLSTKKANGVKTYTAKDIEKMQIDTKIYTDGGCEPNPGKAGSGIAIYRNEQVDELWYGLFEPHGTNNTAELNALHHAMIIADHERKKNRSVAIFCDSKYSIQCITQWASGWQKKGWKKASGEIKNLELIKKMFALYQVIKENVQILHVNGHVGVEGNELADRMSILAINSRTTKFVLYEEALNIKSLLAMRAG